MAHNIRFDLFITAEKLDFDYVADSIPVYWQCRKKSSFNQSVVDAGIACDTMCYGSNKQYDEGASSAFSPIKQFITEYQSHINHIRSVFDSEISVCEYLHTDEGEICDYVLSKYDIRSLNCIGASLNFDVYWYEKEDENAAKDIGNESVQPIMNSLLVLDDLDPIPEMVFELTVSGEKSGFKGIRDFFGSTIQCECKEEDNRLEFNFGTIKECSVSDAFQRIKSPLFGRKDKLSDLLKNYDVYISVGVVGEFAYTVLFELTSNDISFISDIGSGFGIVLK